MILSICMPTYNRREKALIQARNIIQQCNGYVDVEFIISDNYSSDNTSDYIKSIIPQLPPNVMIVRQNENLGLVGNLYYLYQVSHGKYIWFISDDDKVNQGSVASILSLIYEKERDYYLLNFDIEINGVNQGLFWKKKSDNYANEYCDGQTGGFGLISVQVLRKDKFAELYKPRKKYNLMQPVAVSMYGLFYLNGIMVYDKPYVVHHVGDYSWAKRFVEVQSIDLYNAILDLKEFVPNEVVEEYIKMIGRTNIFLTTSFKYILKTRDKWYIKELKSRNLFYSVMVTGFKYYAVAVFKKIFQKI